MYTVKDLFDLDHTLAKDYLSQFTYPWEALKGIKDLILSLGRALDKSEYDEVSENVIVSVSSFTSILTLPDIQFTSMLFTSSALTEPPPVVYLTAFAYTE